MRHPALLALASLLASLAPAMAQPAPPQTQGTGQSTWNTGTAPPPPQAPAEDSTLSLRLYEEGIAGDKPPYKLPYRPNPRRHDDPAWAVDVSAVMTRCPDGNLVITALVIGGQLTPLPNRCPGDRQPDPSAAPDSAASPNTPRCDANTWTCSTRPAD